jgi:hypothetical protein
MGGKKCFNREMLGADRAGRVKLAFDLRWHANMPRVGTQSGVVGPTLHVQMLENVLEAEISGDIALIAD